MESSDCRWAHEFFQTISANIATVIKGQDQAIKKIMAGFAAGGHILLEDNPGTGKTTLAKALAKCIRADFKRIQFTPDLLPSDILGVSIFDPSRNNFKLHKGPVFTNILLADEINRASPRTQSALLESMAEGQISIDGNLLRLKDLFFVIATQNPVESRGTYPLPEAQMDRFTMQLSLGYVQKEDEIKVIDAVEGIHPVEKLGACADLRDCLRLKDLVYAVHVSADLKDYVVDLVSATRKAPGVTLGASVRASISLVRVSQALALFDGLDFVTADQVLAVAEDVISHRLVLDSQAQFSGASSRKIVREIISGLTVPV